MLKPNSMICASVSLLGLDNELMSFGPAPCHLYLFLCGNFERAERCFTQNQGGSGVLGSVVQAWLGGPFPQEGQRRQARCAELAEQRENQAYQGRPWGAKEGAETTERHRPFQQAQFRGTGQGAQELEEEPVRPGGNCR